jgi:hypothetical protein
MGPFLAAISRLVGLILAEKSFPVLDASRPMKRSFAW